MVFFNYATMEMAAKIVYYGPGLCGKTTNLQFIYNKTSRKTRGEMVSLATETDRTLFFDLLPIRLGTVGGFKTRFQLYTVPGQVFYNSTRKLVLKGVDAVVFVADSQEPMLDANIESIENLEENLAEHRLELEAIPWVIQYNKRDLPNILSIDELESELNSFGVPHYESIATTGKGVLETLKGISKLTLKYLRRKTGDVQKEREPVAKPTPGTIEVSSSVSSQPENQEAIEDDSQDVEFDVSGGTETSQVEEVDAQQNSEQELMGSASRAEDFQIKEVAAVGEEGATEEEEEVNEDTAVSTVSSNTSVDVSVSYVNAEEATSRGLGDSKTVVVDSDESSEIYLDSEVIEKMVMKKIIIPININKDDKLKNINLNLKLDVECQLIESEAVKVVSSKKTKTSASALAQKTLEDFLLGKKK